MVFNPNSNIFTGWNWFMTGNAINQISWATSYAQNKTTKQEKRPWLNNAQIKWLEEQTSSLTWATKTQNQTELYHAMIRKIENENISDARTATKNSNYRDSMYEKDTNKKNYIQSNVRLETLADMTKQQFWLDANYDTKQAINWLMAYADDNWVDVNLINNYLQNWDKEFLYQIWFEDRPQKTLWQNLKEIWTDIVWAAYDSVTWLPRMIWKWAADVIGRTAKQLWADENKVNNLVDSYKNYVDENMSWKSIGADTDSITYNVAKWASDLIQVAAWEWLAKGIAKWTQVWSKVFNYLEKAPTWQKMIAWWLEWAWDMALYSMVSEWKLPSLWETWVWAWVWAVIPWAWAVLKAGWKIVKSAAKDSKVLKNMAAKLELNSMLNPAKLNDIKNQLITEWTDLASAWLKWWTAEDVWTWMVERWFKWDKETIIQWLKDYSEKSYNLKREVLWASNTLHKVESADKALEVVYNTIKDTPWLEKKAARIEELMAKENKSLSELDEIRWILWDTMPIYKNSWEVGAGATKEWLSKIYNDLKTYIEKAADTEWIWNIKMLNNETQISHSLADAISKKDSADAVRDFLSIYGNWLIWWFAWSQWVWVFDNNTIPWKIWNTIVWALAWKYLFSTKAKTTLANALNKLSWWTKKELERYLTNQSTKLSKATERELWDVLKVLDDVKMPTAKEFTEDEYKAILSRYSKEDLPALWFKDWVENYNTIIWNDSKKIIADAEWNAIREWQIWEKATQNINYIKQQLKDAGVSDSKIDEVVKELENKTYSESIPRDEIVIKENEINKYLNENDNPIVDLKTWKTLNEQIEDLRKMKRPEENIQNYKRDILKKINEGWLKTSEKAGDSFKKKQLEIIQWENPMTDEYHLWIRSENDIKTWEEAVQDSESFTWGDFSKADAEKALSDWFVRIYSSKPIVNWNFVTTSKNMAKDYAWWWKIYSQKVGLKDVAWLNWDEWQFAKVPWTTPWKTVTKWNNFDISNVKKEYWDNFDKIMIWEIEDWAVWKVQAWIAYDWKERPAIFSQDIRYKLDRDHGIDKWNLLWTLDKPDYIIKNMNNDENKINIIRKIPWTNDYVLIWANRNNWYFIVTNYEVHKNNANQIMNDIKRLVNKWQLAYDRIWDLTKK